GLPIEFGFFVVNSHTASFLTSRTIGVENLEIELALGPPAPLPTLEETFAYPLGLLAGRNGGSGWTDPWTAAGEGNQVCTSELTYQSGTRVLQTSSNALCFAGQDFGNFRPLPVPAGAAGTTLYISALCSLPSGQYSGLSLYDGSDEKLFIGRPFETGVYGIHLHDPPANPSLTLIPSSQTAFVVCRIDFEESRRKILFYVNPGLASEPSQATLQTVALATWPISHIRLQGGGGAVDGKITAIRIGRFWTNVT